MDIKFLYKKIKNILERNHSEYEKQQIKDYPGRYNFACPICGDSEDKTNKKRGNLFFKNLRYICFNCEYSMPITKFFDMFNEHIDLDNRIKIYNYIDENTVYRKTDDYIIEELSELINIEDFINYFNNYEDSWLVDIKPLQKGSRVYQYIKYERLIQYTDQIYEGRYRFFKNGKVVFDSDVLINLNITSGDDKKIIGIQLRNLEKSDKRFYKIVEFEQIYNYMNPNKHLDEAEAISYNKLSHFYNLMNINFDKDITIFEGYLDSTFYPNSIGMVGAKNDQDLLKFLINSDDNLKIRFFYDNDVTGIIKSTKMLKSGQSVFLWNKLFKDLKKYKYETLQKNIIDLNQLVVLLKDPNIYQTLNLDNYFSKDEFDLMYLDKVVFDKHKKEWKIIRN